MEKPPDTRKQADTHVTQLLQHEFSSQFQAVRKHDATSNFLLSCLVVNI